MHISAKILARGMQKSWVRYPIPATPALCLLGDLGGPEVVVNTSVTSAHWIAKKTILMNWKMLVRGLARGSGLWCPGPVWSLDGCLSVMGPPGLCLCSEVGGWLSWLRWRWALCRGWSSHPPVGQATSQSGTWLCSPHYPNAPAILHYTH